MTYEETFRHLASDCESAAEVTEVEWYFMRLLINATHCKALASSAAAGVTPFGGSYDAWDDFITEVKVLLKNPYLK